MAHRQRIEKQLVVEEFFMLRKQNYVSAEVSKYLDELDARLLSGEALPPPTPHACKAPLPLSSSAHLCIVIAYVEFRGVFLKFWENHEGRLRLVASYEPLNRKIDDEREVDKLHFLQQGRNFFPLTEAIIITPPRNKNIGSMPTSSPQLCRSRNPGNTPPLHGGRGRKNSATLVQSRGKEAEMVRTESNPLSITIGTRELSPAKRCEDTFLSPSQCDVAADTSLVCSPPAKPCDVVSHNQCDVAADASLVCTPPANPCDVVSSHSQCDVAADASLVCTPPAKPCDVVSSHSQCDVAADASLVCTPRAKLCEDTLVFPRQPAKDASLALTLSSVIDHADLVSQKNPESSKSKDKADNLSDERGHSDESLWNLSSSSSSSEDTNESKVTQKLPSAILAVEKSGPRIEMEVIYDNLVITTEYPTVSMDTISSQDGYINYLEMNRQIHYFRKFLPSDWHKTPSNGFCGFLVAYGTDLTRFPGGYPLPARLDIGVRSIRDDFLNFLRETVDIVQDRDEISVEYPKVEVDLMDNLETKLYGVINYLLDNPGSVQVSSESNLWLFQEEAHALISLRRKVSLFSEADNRPGYARFLRDLHGKCRFEWLPSDIRSLHEQSEMVFLLFWGRHFMVMSNNICTSKDLDATETRLSQQGMHIVQTLKNQPPRSLFSEVMKQFSNPHDDKKETLSIRETFDQEKVLDVIEIDEARLVQNITIGGCVLQLLKHPSVEGRQFTLFNSIYEKEWDDPVIHQAETFTCFYSRKKLLFLRYCVHESPGKASFVPLAIWQTGCPLKNIVLILKHLESGMIERVQLFQKENKFLETYKPNPNVRIDFGKLHEEYNQWVISNDLKFDPGKSQ
jgi:hypothetical protein